MAKKKTFKKRTNADIMKKITNKVIEALKGGKVAWQRPWVNTEMPMNYITKKAYQGINLWMTFFAPYDSPYWITYKQAKKLGGNVKKGEKGTSITFWKIIVKPITDENGKPIMNKLGNQKMQKIFLLKDYTIFNAEQCEGIEFDNPKKLVEGADNDKNAEDLIKLYVDKPEIRHSNEPRAYYAMDLANNCKGIHMPNKATFKSTEAYYATLFHELTHSTGHKSRLNRESLMTRTKDNYSVEELVAEMGACLMMAKSGLQLEPSDNSKAYIQGWISRLENDHKFIFQASRDAQKACNYMLGIEETKYNDEVKEDKKENNIITSKAA